MKCPDRILGTTSQAAEVCPLVTMETNYTFLNAFLSERDPIQMRQGEWETKSLLLWISTL